MMTLLFFIAAIGPLIFFHELGHYWVGRWCGIRAEVFAIGFGREIFGWTDKRGTRWKVGWIPLGGYVRFAGDMNAVGAEDPRWKDLPEDQKNGVFHSKPVWKRALTVAAGPFANFLLAALIYMGLFGTYGAMRTPPVADWIAPNSAAAKAGFQAGDRIVSINEKEMDEFSDVQAYIMMRASQLVTFEIDRGGKRISITAAPDERQEMTRFGSKVSFGQLGIRAIPARRVHFSALELPGVAVGEVFSVIDKIVDGMKQIVMGYHSVKEFGGVVTIAKMSADMASMGWVAFLAFLAFFSINLGFINLLPVPMLDGGHLLFYGIEAVRRRPVSMAALEWTYRAGFALVIGFMIFVTVNDLARYGYLGKLGGLIG